MCSRDIVFEADGSMTVHFHGIKNDTNRQGFEVNIPAYREHELFDPVSCLKTYITRTNSVRIDAGDALFATLKSPNKTISAETVASV